MSAINGFKKNDSDMSKLLTAFHFARNGVVVEMCKLDEFAVSCTVKHSLVIFVFSDDKLIN
uniref:Uncharacterized protein n=1 Tax=Strigamia maritima TaxID=126957 RepID=T1JAR5_STRMM